MSPMSNRFEQDTIETMPAPAERKVPSERKAPAERNAPPALQISEFEEDVPTVVRVRTPRYMPPKRSPAS